MTTKYLYAVELDITREALWQGRRVGPDGYWVIHDEGTVGDPWLCVYETLEEALEAAKGRDHKSRVVRFTRGKVVK